VLVSGNLQLGLEFVESINAITIYASNISLWHIQRTLFGLSGKQCCWTIYKAENSLTNLVYKLKDDSAKFVIAIQRLHSQFLKIPNTFEKKKKCHRQ
jgi:hypothetical protein